MEDGTCDGNTLCGQVGSDGEVTPDVEGEAGPHEAEAEATATAAAATTEVLEADAEEADVPEDEDE